MNNNSKVEFIDTSKDVINEMKNLSKQALKAGGKVITSILRQDIAVRTGGLKKSITAWAKIDKEIGQPVLEVGYRSKAQMLKRGVKFFVNPCWFEFGTKPHTIMTKSFKDNGKSNYELSDHQNNKYGVIVQHPGMQRKNLLRNTVFNNIDEIQKAEEEHLNRLNDIVIKTSGSISLNEEAEEID